MDSTASMFTSALVVGGCGFLGHHIVTRLLEDLPNVKVSVLDLRTDKNRFPNVKYYDGDITSAQDVVSVLKAVQPQVLFHTAAPTAIRFNKEIFDKVNLQGTQNLLTCAARSSSVKALVYTSSASIVHDNVSDLVGADESWPILDLSQQRFYYAWTKGAAELMVLKANRSLDFNRLLTTAVRPCGLFGEGDVQVTPPMLEMYLTSKHFWQLGDNTNMFDWTYVSNCAHAHVLAAKALWQTLGMSGPPLDYERVDGEAFIVTNDETAPFWNFPHLIWRAAGWKGSPGDAWVIPRGPGLVIATIIEWLVWIFTLGMREAQFKREAVNFSSMTRTFNIDKAKQRLGYRPIVNMEDGVKRTTEWLLKDPERQKKLPASKKKAQ